MNEELKKLILDSKVVSFDIFDTLITRIVDRPETVFEIMEQKFNLKNFSRLRQEMQAKIGLELMNEKNYPHANLNEIYDYISKNTSIDNCDELLKYELQLEKDILYRNPQIYEIYKFAKANKKKVVATSDMYIEYNDIKDILSNCGYNDLDAIYLSSKERKAKFNGQLFDFLIENEGVNANQILHIGDNYDHDFILAKKKNITVYHYKETLVTKKSNNIIQSIHNGICRYIKLCNNDFWINIGAKAGLLYYGLYQELIHKNKNHIYFISRDGYNMYNIFKKFNSKIKVDYVYTSRRAMLLASIDKLDDNSLVNLPPFTFGQTVGEILDYISIRDIFNKDDLNSVDIDDFDYRVTSLSDFDKMKKLYLLKSDKVLEVCNEERKNAKKYFEKLNILDNNSFFFDCGWNGSSQYLLNNLINKISSNSNLSFYYTGIFNSEKSEFQLKNLDYDTYLFDFDKNISLIDKLRDNIVILELFFGSDENSVLKYTKDGYQLDNLETDFDYKKSILDGLIEYFKIILPFMKKYEVTFDCNEAIKPIINLIYNPTQEEAVTIGDIANVDGFVTQKGIVKHIANVSIDDIKQNENIEIYWKNGLLVRDDIDDVVKNFVKQKYKISLNDSSLEDNISANSVQNFGYFKRLKRSLSVNGYRTTSYLLRKRIKSKIFGCDTYHEWIKINEKNIYKVKKISYRPLISIVVPVYNVIRSELVECINSVLNQTYDKYELILVDDNSSLLETKEVLKEFEDFDSRIKIIYHDINGHISKTTNDGIKIANGEFIALLDNDDVLAPNALYEMVLKLNENRNLDFIYSDEDKLSCDGTNRHDPFFKPDWSPDTFMSLMYTCHFSIFRKKIVDDIGGFTVGLDGAQDYDFVLRFTEKTNNVAHIPKILYHWRERDGSIASNPEAKPYALNAIVKLKQNALNRNNLNGKIIYDSRVFQYRVVYQAPNNNTTIIIFSNNYNSTINLVKSIEKLNDLAINKIIILTEHDYLFDFKDTKLDITSFKIKSDLKVRYKYIMENVKTKFVLVIDDSVSFNCKDSVSIMTGAAEVNNVLLVGPKIMVNDSNIIMSDGITPSINCNVMNNFDNNIPHYYCRNILDYNTFSISDKCMLFKLDKLKKYIDEIDYSNISLSIGEIALKKGYYNVIRNDIYVNYYNYDDIFKNKVINSINDPYINSNLNSDFSIDLTSKNYNKVKNINSFECIGDIKNVKYEIEMLKSKDYYKFQGYIFLINNYKNNSNKISIILKGKDCCYKIKTYKVYNKYTSLKHNTNLNFANFKALINLKKLNHGKYDVYINVKNVITRTDNIYNIDTTIEL